MVFDRETYRKEYSRHYYEIHKEKILSQKKQYHEMHKEKILSQKKQYYEMHKEKISEYQKQYHDTHRGEIALQLKEHRTRCPNYYSKSVAYKRGFGFTPLNAAFWGSHAHHLLLENNNSFCVYVPCFLHEGIKHNSKTGEGMQTVNAVALSYWLIDYQFFKDV